MYDSIKNKFLTKVPDVFEVADALREVDQFSPINLLKAFKHFTGKTLSYCREEVGVYLNFYHQK